MYQRLSILYQILTSTGPYLTPAGCSPFQFSIRFSHIYTFVITPQLQTKAIFFQFSIRFSPCWPIRWWPSRGPPLSILYQILTLNCCPCLPLLAAIFQFSIRFSPVPSVFIRDEWVTAFNSLSDSHTDILTPLSSGASLSFNSLSDSHSYDNLTPTANQFELSILYQILTHLELYRSRDHFGYLSILYQILTA